MALANSQTGKVAMCGHTRRFNPSHQYVQPKIKAGEFNIQQMDVQTYFFRRTNMNALGQPAAGPTTCCGTTRRTPWTCLPTKRAAPSSKRMRCKARSTRAGHRHGHEHSAQAANGAICTLSLSFNNDGPLGTYFRYIGDTATYLARYDDLFTGKEEKIDVSPKWRSVDERH